jgi:oligo-1,6-glucosidase
MDLDRDPAGSSKWHRQPWDLIEMKRIMTRWQKDLEHKGWNSFYLSNHDQPRSVSRFGDDEEYRVESAKLLATFLHMLHGTPYVYQGEEIGMTNVRFASIADYRDIETLNMYREFVEEKGLDPADVMAMIYRKSRDNARTPMQWDATANAGFSTGTPWLAVNPNYQEINVAADRADAASIWAYYRQLIQLRREHPVIVYGTYDLLLPEHRQLYVFTRTLGDDRLLVILNWTRSEQPFALPPEVRCDAAELLIANYAVAPDEAPRQLTLRPYEARVYRLR